MAANVEASEAPLCEVWEELDGVASDVKTLVLSKVAGFTSHRYVDERLVERSGLTFLDLSRCGLEALVELRGLGQLKDLNLSQNPLGPALRPSGSLGGLSRLRSLDVSSAGLEALPQSLVTLESLESLNASSNALTSVAMVDLASLPKLRTANFAGNRVSSISAAAHGLRSLNVSDNALTSLDGLKGSEDLVDLDASRNALARVRATQGCHFNLSRERSRNTHPPYERP